jgi:ubiquinol-cytochrome c reductase cytochrome c1 subunit
MKHLISLFCTASLLAGAVSANEALKPPKQEWSFNKVFGTFDRAGAQRGFQVYKEVCAACHSLKEVRFGKLTEIGFKESEAKAIAKGYEVASIDDEGNPITVPAKLTDHFKGPYANAQAGRAANNGALPPDLSLMVKARPGGADYIYALLTSFQEPPAGVKLMSGMHYNLYFPGHQIAMPPPLSEGQVTYVDGTKATVAQMAHDVVTFLAWAAEPEMEARKRMGVKVITFLSIFAGMLYIVMRRTWKVVKDVRE